MPIRPSGSISLFGRRGITAACVILIAMHFLAKTARRIRRGTEVPSFPAENDTAGCGGSDDPDRFAERRRGVSCRPAVYGESLLQVPACGGAEMRILVAAKNIRRRTIIRSYECQHHAGRFPGICSPWRFHSRRQRYYDSRYPLRTEQ